MGIAAHLLRSEAGERSRPKAELSCKKVHRTDDPRRAGVMMLGAKRAVLAPAGKLELTEYRVFAICLLQSKSNQETKVLLGKLHGPVCSNSTTCCH
jgi:hypothetical protein